jgi:hypothetical protein
MALAQQCSSCNKTDAAAACGKTQVPGHFQALGLPTTLMLRKDDDDDKFRVFPPGTHSLADANERSHRSLPGQIRVFPIRLPSNAARWPRAATDDERHEHHHGRRRRRWRLISLPLTSCARLLARELLSERERERGVHLGQGMPARSAKGKTFTVKSDAASKVKSVSLGQWAHAQSDSANLHRPC